jgi:multidrug efflux system membrane fusion protein
MQHIKGFAIVFMAASAVVACHAPEAPVVSARPVAVIAPQALRDAGSAEFYPGTVRARVESALSFRVAGKIIERRVDIGAQVRKGDVLAVLDPIDARLNVQAAESSVAAAEADARLAESEFQRHVDLNQRGFVSASLLDLRRNQMELAQARLKQARSQLAVSRNQAAYTSLVADADGLVTQVQADAGRVVAAGEPVLGFARNGEREVRINVPEGAAVERLRSAPSLRVSLWAQPGKLYEARVREIAGSADASTRTHEARISIVNADDAVKLGMTASVQVGTPAEEPLWRLPLTAVGDSSGTPVVWRVIAAGEQLQAQPLPVKVVQLLNDAVIIAGDIKPDDRLISAGVHLLTPAMPVKPIDRSAPVAL